MTLGPKHAEQEEPREDLMHTGDARGFRMTKVALDCGGLPPRLLSPMNKEYCPHVQELFENVCLMYDGGAGGRV